MVCLLKQIPVNKGCGPSHNDQVNEERQIGIDGQHASGTNAEYYRRMNQGIHGIHSQKAGRYNPVVNNRLKND